MLRETPCAIRQSNHVDESKATPRLLPLDHPCNWPPISELWTQDEISGSVCLEVQIRYLLQYLTNSMCQRDSVPIHSTLITSRISRSSWSPVISAASSFFANAAAKLPEIRNTARRFQFRGRHDIAFVRNHQPDRQGGQASQKLLGHFRTMFPHEYAVNLARIDPLIVSPTSPASASCGKSRPLAAGPSFRIHARIAHESATLLTRASSRAISARCSSSRAAVRLGPVLTIPCMVRQSGNPPTTFFMMRDPPLISIAI